MKSNTLYVNYCIIWKLKEDWTLFPLLDAVQMWKEGNKLNSS